MLSCSPNSGNGDERSSKPNDRETVTIIMVALAMIMVAGAEVAKEAAEKYPAVANAGTITIITTILRMPLRIGGWDQ